MINTTGRPVVVVGTGYGEKPPYGADTDRLFAFYARTGSTVRDGRSTPPGRRSVRRRSAS